MGKRHRTFIAINLPEEIKRELFSYSEKWQKLQAKWTVKDNLHITLEFLGNLTDGEIGEVCMVAKEVAERQRCFSLDIAQVVYGPTEVIAPQSVANPNAKPPRMIWAVGEKSKELSALRQELETALTGRVSFIPENRTLAPHITLARISAWAWKQIEPEERPEINENIDLLFTVESIEVMESVLKRGGPQYTILESHNLKI